MAAPEYAMGDLKTFHLPGSMPNYQPSIVSRQPSFVQMADFNPNRPPTMYQQSVVEPSFVQMTNFNVPVSVVNYQPSFINVPVPMANYSPEISFHDSRADDAGCCDQSCCRKHCCATTMDMFATGENTVHNNGRCVTNSHRTFYNKEVAKLARTSTGIYVTLSEDAQRKIFQVYDGSPLLVKPAKAFGLGGVCKAFVCGFWKGVVEATCEKFCGPCGSLFLACIHCSGCSLESSDAAPIEGIWYARRDVTSAISWGGWAN